MNEPIELTVRDDARKGRVVWGIAFCALAIGLLLYSVVVTVIVLGLRADAEASNRSAACRGDLSAQVDVVLIDEVNELNTLLAALSVQPRNQADVVAALAAFQATQARVLEVRDQRANTGAICGQPPPAAVAPAP